MTPGAGDLTGTSVNWTPAQNGQGSSNPMTTGEDGKLNHPNLWNCDNTGSQDPEHDQLWTRYGNYLPTLKGQEVMRIRVQNFDGFLVQFYDQDPTDKSLQYL